MTHRRVLVPVTVDVEGGEQTSPMLLASLFTLTVLSPRSDVKLLSWFIFCAIALFRLTMLLHSQSTSLAQPASSPHHLAGDAAVDRSQEVDPLAIAALSQAKKACGGLQRLQAIRDVTRSVEMVNLATNERAKATLQIIFPDVIYLKTDSPLGELTAFSDGKSAWAASGFGVDEKLPNWQIQASRLDLYRQLESLLLSDRDPDRKVEFLGRSEVDGRPANLLRITSDAGPIRLWIDSSSGYVLELEYRRVVARGSGPLVTDFFSDYRWVNRALRVPFHIHTLSDGQPYMDTQVLQVQYNHGLQAEILGRKPDPQKQ